MPIYLRVTQTHCPNIARPDLIFDAYGGRKKSLEKYDYIIIGTAGNADQKFSEFQRVFLVKLDGVRFVDVKNPTTSRRGISLLMNKRWRGFTGSRSWEICREGS